MAVELDLRPAWAMQLTLSLEKSVGTISNHISVLFLLPSQKITLTCILSQFTCYGELLKVRRFQLLLFTCISKEGQVLWKLQPLLSHPIPLITKHTWILDRKGPACYAVHTRLCPCTMESLHSYVVRKEWVSWFTLYFLSFLFKRKLSLAESFILCIFLTSCIFFILNLFIYLCQYFHLLFYAIFRILL